MKIIVKKYGGATLANPEKIKQVANSLYRCHQNGDRLVVIVSAMGQTTNELIALANQVSTKPKRRELDMLLTTGERISMSLLSLALNDLSCAAISFTGSQAGVLTDDAHLNAFITDVKCPRVVEALKKNTVVIIAGFQGVSPQTKEVTTLGRGGSDTTAVAISAALNAHHCEILKDVPSIFSADPKVCPSAHSLHQLNYQQLLEMTFWGAKVLHYRSVELAYQRQVPLYIGPAHSSHTHSQNHTHNHTKNYNLKNPDNPTTSFPNSPHEVGTWVTPSHSTKENAMFESTQIISINSHAEVLKLSVFDMNLASGLEHLKSELAKKEIPLPQLLASESSDFPNVSNSPETLVTEKTPEITKTINAPTSIHSFYLSGPTEILNAIKKEVKNVAIDKENFCTVTVTCTGASTPEIASQISQKLAQAQINPLRLWMSGMSCTVLLLNEQRSKAIKELHTLIPPTKTT